MEYAADKMLATEHFSLIRQCR